MPRFILLLLLMVRIAAAAFELQAGSALQIAQANILAQFPGGLNPAVHFEQPGWNTNLTYGKLYGLAKLTLWSNQLHWQINRRQRIGLDYSSVGNTFYREQTYSISYGRQVYPYVGLGLRVSIYDLYVENYTVKPTIGFSLGTIFQTDTNYSIGILLTNLNQPHLHNQPNQIPRTFTCGFRWRVHPRLCLAAELYKDLDFPLAEKLGCDLQLLPFWHLVGGVRLNPENFNLGTAFSWHGFTAMMALQQHPTLPMTLYFGLGWQSQ